MRQPRSAEALLTDASAEVAELTAALRLEIRRRSGDREGVLCQLVEALVSRGVEPHISTSAEALTGQGICSPHRLLLCAEDDGDTWVGPPVSISLSRGVLGLLEGRRKGQAEGWTPERLDLRVGDTTVTVPAVIDVTAALAELQLHAMDHVSRLTGLLLRNGERSSIVDRVQEASISRLKTAVCSEWIMLSMMIDRMSRALPETIMMGVHHTHESLDSASGQAGEVNMIGSAMHMIAAAKFFDVNRRNLMVRSALQALRTGFFLPPKIAPMGGFMSEVIALPCHVHAALRAMRCFYRGDDEARFLSWAEVALIRCLFAQPPPSPVDPSWIATSPREVQHG